ncbi:MAG TPA: Crp/Fnr family transcriptional regulator [Candidatus Sulfopaludibacter sp.]|nr:Crp/Fnr family transcriptional regulator [Candidatus Sulfopaludibacter sp.]
MTKTSTTLNLLLRAAPAARRSRTGGLKHIMFAAGTQFWQEGEALTQVLFPLRGILSLQMSAGPGKRVEVGLVGAEGVAGISLFLGEPKARMTVVALTDGEAVAMPRQVFQSCLDSPVFRAAVNRYLRFFILMLAKLAVCNRAHVLESLCAGRLLLMQDRTGGDSFLVTQEFLSRLLGVRRATVSHAASRLQKGGSISYDRRGRLQILDRKRLEKAACSCYRAIKADFDRLVIAQGGW